MTSLATMLVEAAASAATAPTKASPRRKTTKAAADKIRSQHAHGASIACLMREHGLRRDCIQGIIDGRYYTTPDRPAQAPIKRSVTWRHVDAVLPDSDIEVMVALDDGDVRPGFHDGEQWRDLTAWPLPDGAVLMWCDYPDHPRRRP